MSDLVNHPPHYQSDSGIECIDAIRAALGFDGFQAYCRGNAIKYAWRAHAKGNPAQDLRKAAWYLSHAAEALESKAHAETWADAIGDISAHAKVYDFDGR